MKRFLLSLLLIIQGVIMMAQSPTQLGFYPLITLTPQTYDSVSQNDILVYWNVWFENQIVDIVPGYWTGDNNGTQFLGKFRPWKYTNQDNLNQQWQFQLVTHTGPGARYDTTGTTRFESPFYTGYTVAQGTTWPQREIINGCYVDIDYSTYDTTTVFPGGMDSPENFLGYVGFHNTYDNGGQNNDLNGTSSFTDSTGTYSYDGNGLHRYIPHLADYQPTSFSWGDSAEAILGAVQYLHSRGINSLSFVSVNSDDGDGGDTWPTVAVPDGTGDFDPDIVKLNQWDKLIGYIDSLGMTIYWKLHETENDQWTLDWFRAYSYEMIARYGHYQNIVWIISEEISLNQSQIAARAQWLDGICPKCEVSLHTFPDQQDQKFPGILPWLESLELQEGLGGIDGKLEDWVGQGKAVSWSEQNGANVGISNPTQTDDYTNAMGRSAIKDLAGFLGYRGYNWEHSDLDLESFRVVHILQPISVAVRVIESEDWWKMSYDDNISTNDNYVRVNSNRTRFVAYCEDGDNLVLDYNWLLVPQHETTWIDALTGDTLGVFTTTAGSMNPAYEMNNPSNGPVWAITVPKGVPTSLDIVDFSNFKNLACVSTDEYSTVRWFRRTVPGDWNSAAKWQMVHAETNVFGETCYEYYACGAYAFQQLDAYVEVRDLQGNVQELYFITFPEPQKFRYIDGRYYFPCGDQEWFVINTTGQTVAEGKGSYYEPDSTLSPGIYYIMTQVSSHSISIGD